MGNKFSIDLEERTLHGKKVAQLRQNDITPAVVYGPGIKPVSVQAPRPVFEKLYKQAGLHSPVHLVIGTKKHIAMIKDVEFDQVRHTINHVSFHAVKASDPVTAEVPIRLIGTGESEAEKAGLIVLQALEKIQVKALPMDLPEALELSIAGLATTEDRLIVGDIKLPTNVELVDHVADPNATEEETHSVTELVVASVYEPSALAAANDAAGGDAAADDVEDVAADNGGDTPQGGEEKSENPGGKKAKEDHGE